MGVLQDFKKRTAQQQVNKFTIGDKVRYVGPSGYGAIGKIEGVLDFMPGDQQWFYRVDMYGGGLRTIGESYLEEYDVGSKVKSQPAGNFVDPIDELEPQPQQQSKPFAERMQDTLRGLTVSPTDKKMKQDYEDLLREQQENEMKSLRAKRKKR